MKLRRIDSELVRRGLAHSRTSAQELILAGRVLVDGEEIHKPARQVDPAQAIVIRESDQIEYASRGAHKLAGALDALGEKGPRIAGRRCLDAGASTGGFTDVLLRRGASSVVAVDVGYGQLIWRLRTDPRVEVHDRTNVRTLRAGDITPPPSLIVSDLSFISLTLVLPALVDVASDDAEFLLMVKPQFEIGKERLGHGGVVRNPEHHVETVCSVAQCAFDHGLGISAVEASPLPGPAGNVEYFIYMHRQQEGVITRETLKTYVKQAVQRGPMGNARPL
ncbi:TlyA family RNA methyltransferase [Schaalia sp. lx-260]|uniref:TlyA family RNA methyltransferase n=1 Tax=Schaalia sp. lx-260 TaxID=2899082 RepID=UPI001E62B534|nr:TlyA family RNA methyltransferase [Schaalia sp. lx-260]